MGRPKNAQPTYLRHEPSGQARIRVNGREIYLGEWQSAESWQRYYAACAKIKAGETPTEKPQLPPRSIRVDELVAAYLEHAEDYYRSNWRNARYHILPGTNILLSLFAAQPVSEFGPLKLKRVIEQLLINGDQRKEVKRNGWKPLSQSSIRQYLGALKLLFKWGVSAELVPSSVADALQYVEPPRPGRGKLGEKVRKNRDIKPVTNAEIAAVLPHLSPEVAAMVQVQLLAVMRPDEVTIIRPCDLDMSQATKKRPNWIYRPAKHKTDYIEGQEVKEILIGPKAQKILKPFIDDCDRPTDYLFSPKKVAARAIAKQCDENETPNSRRRAASLARLNQLRPPRDHYDDSTYRGAVHRACRAAKIAEWSPNQLRHAGGTEIRALAAKYDLTGAEAAQLTLQHRNLSTTEIYAERNREKYHQIMAELG